MTVELAPWLRAAVTAPIWAAWPSLMVVGCSSFLTRHSVAWTRASRRSLVADSPRATSVALAESKQEWLAKAEDALSKGLCGDDDPCDTCLAAARRIIVHRRGIEFILDRLAKKLGER
jgi:hypothetical protein